MVAWLQSDGQDLVYYSAALPTVDLDSHSLMSDHVSHVSLRDIIGS
jgi:hypothetical protein